MNFQQGNNIFEQKEREREITFVIPFSTKISTESGGSAAISYNHVKSRNKNICTVSIRNHRSQSRYYYFTLFHGEKMSLRKNQNRPPLLLHAIPLPSLSPSPPLSTRRHFPLEPIFQYLSTGWWFIKWEYAARGPCARSRRSITVSYCFES